MRVFLFSDTKKIEKHFESVRKSKNYDLYTYPVSEMRSLVKKATKGSLIYLDISGLTNSEITKYLNYLLKQNSICFGIVDPKGTIEDVSVIFHKGASDYICPKILKLNIHPKRIENAVKFSAIETPEPSRKLTPKKYIPSGRDWKGVVQGREYTFCFMFVELENKTALKKLSPQQFNRITASFHDCIAETTTPFGGRIWIWMDVGGLILFPFDGRKCDAIEAAFRFMLARKLISAEHIDLDIDISYRIAMHIGDTVYRKRGDTGTIVSDSINSVFHLGQKYTEPGGFCLTDEVSPFIPEGLTDHFKSAGQYEGRSILRMKPVL